MNRAWLGDLHYVHNNLNRTIEDLGRSSTADEGYRLGNPGEGSHVDHAASAAPLTGGGSSRCRSRSVSTTRSSSAQPPVLEQLVRQRQL